VYVSEDEKIEASADTATILVKIFGGLIAHDGTQKRCVIVKND
jgi:hypothetical protein